MMYAFLAVLGFVITFFFAKSRQTSSQDAQVLDLTAKIAEKQGKEKSLEDKTDADMAAYKSELAKLDPNFHGDDGDPKKPSS
jgi:hypothetical protein